MYASGLPVLYPIAFLNFFFLYWIYKGLLVKYYQKTIAFNQDLPIYTIRYFKFAVFFHVIMAAFIFTNHHMISSERLDEVATPVTDQASSYSSEYGAAGGAVTVSLSARFSRPIGLVYLIFIILLSLGFIFENTLYNLVSNFFQKLCGKSKAEKEAAERQ